jgi:hypothetical protein
VIGAGALGVVGVAGAWALSRPSLRPLMETLAKAVSFEEACEGGAALRRSQTVATEVSKLVHPALAVQVEGAPEWEVLGGESFSASVGGLCLSLSRLKVELSSVRDDPAAAKRLVQPSERHRIEEDDLWGVAEGSITFVEGGVTRRFAFSSELGAARDPLQLLVAVVRVRET